MGRDGRKCAGSPSPVSLAVLHSTRAGGLLAREALMRRREVIYGLSASLALGRGLPAAAQATRPRKVGVVASEAHLHDALVTGLRELGWDPGRDIDVLRAGAGTLDDIDRLLEWDPEVLVTGGAVRIVHAVQRAPRKPIIAIDLESSFKAYRGPEVTLRAFGSICLTWREN